MGMGRTRRAALGLAACGALAALCWGAARAQGAPRFAAGAAAGVQRLSTQERQERRFLQDAAAMLRLQAEASRLAFEHAQDAAVHEVAAQVLAHHADAQAGLQRLLQARGMALPLQGNGHLKTVKLLGRARGRTFDRLYLQEVVVKPVADADYYQRIAAGTEDPALQRWIARQLRAMRDHQALAQPLAPRTGAAPVRGRAAAL
jgi:predicted outer membrane protein